MNTHLQFEIDDEIDEQVSPLIFHSHDQLFEIPGAIQLQNYITPGSIWRNCICDLITIQFKTGQKAKVTDYIIGPGNSHIYIFYNFYNFQPRSNVYIIDSTTETKENFFLFRGQLNSHKTILHLDLKHKFHRNYTQTTVGTLHLTNRYEENALRNFYAQMTHEGDDRFFEI